MIDLFDIIKTTQGISNHDILVFDTSSLAGITNKTHRGVNMKHTGYVKCSVLP